MNKQLLQCCASLREGDGISPRHEKKERDFYSTNNGNRRLCRQIQKISRMAITELGLESWDVDSVQQLPGKSTLLLILVPLVPQSVLEREQVLEWLHEKQGAIRSRIAMGIHRKAVPSLDFQLKKEDS